MRTQLDVDRICTEIYSDIKGLMANFVMDKNLPETRLTLETRIREYMTSRLTSGDIFFVPNIEVTDKVYTHVGSEVLPSGEVGTVINKLIDQESINLTFFHPKTGAKLDAIDELVTPLAKFNSVE